MSGLRLRRKTSLPSASPPAAPTLFLVAIFVVSASSTALSRVERGVTLAIVNADLQPTASFVMNPDIDFEDERDAGRTSRRHRRQETGHYRRNSYRVDLDGRQHRNQCFMLGFAFQKGAIPLSLEAILEPSKSTAPPSR